MTLRHFTTLVSLLAAGATPLAAQVRYAQSGADTLRYREVTSLRTVVTLPNGDMPVANEHDGSLAVVLFPGDSAIAWYTALRLSANGPTGLLSPDTRAILNDPFRFRFDGRGLVTKVTTPVFPAPIAGITDLTQQFDDFFPHLPATGLRVGQRWTDTVTTADTTEKMIAARHVIVDYVVVRDTVTAGGQAYIISMRQQYQRTAQNRGTIGQLRTTMAGLDSGTVVFGRNGRLLRRERSATLPGTMWISNPSGEHTFRTLVTYTSRIDLLP